ncbi:hypothetical protein [Saccharopolyspora shandongensis]|uniref:hypothetical protein n=1 Tax=Saccharopolyspora shandongensis TaxID=418495 RepID=UPI0033F3BFA7
MFVGRADLLALVDRLTDVSRAYSGETRPVLVIEGCGGSGRTAVLERAVDAWQGRTPTVLVRPRLLDDDGASPVRPVLAAIMLGLSLGAPGYSVAFPRVVLAQIAISLQAGDLDPRKSLEQLNKALNTYNSRSELLGFVRGLANVAGALVNIPVPEPVADDIAKVIVDRLHLSRWMTRRTWNKEALAWFGHQGRQRALKPEEVLLGLNTQARSKNAAIRRDVDDLLVNALLADLRHSLAHAGGRPANVLVLLDDGDTAPAMSFTGSLLRVRKALAASPGNPDSKLPDPLTLVTTSAGALATALSSRPAHETGTGEVSGWWIRMPLPDLEAADLVEWARNFPGWNRNFADGPEELGATAVARAAYKLTHGHPESTAFVLGRLHDEPNLVGDLDELLRAEESEGPVERRLLAAFVRGLDASKHVDDTLVEALITLSAARNRVEATALAPLLPAPVGFDSELFTSATLWSPTSPGAEPSLHPLARYLGMRALASRGEDETALWRTVFESLRGKVAPGNRASQLYYQRMLGESDAVAAELADLLPELPAEEWLALFDAVVAMPDPRARDVEQIRRAGRPGTRHGHVVRLLGVIPAHDKDPCVTEWSVRKKLRSHAAHSFQQLTEHLQGQDPLPFIWRAQRYGGRRDELS